MLGFHPFASVPAQCSVTCSTMCKVRERGCRFDPQRRPRIPERHAHAHFYAHRAAHVPQPRAWAVRGGGLAMGLAQLENDSY